MEYKGEARLAIIKKMDSMLEKVIANEWVNEQRNHEKHTIDDNFKFDIYTNLEDSYIVFPQGVYFHLTVTKNGYKYDIQASDKHGVLTWRIDHNLFDEVSTELVIKDFQKIIRYFSRDTTRKEEIKEEIRKLKEELKHV